MAGETKQPAPDADKLKRDEIMGRRKVEQETTARVNELPPGTLDSGFTPAHMHSPVDGGGNGE